MASAARRPPAAREAVAAGMWDAHTMTTSGPTGAAALADACYAIAAFAADRRQRGDPVARNLIDQFTRLDRPRPPRTEVRRWLGDISAGHRLIRFDSDPWTAERLLAQLTAAEKRTGAAGQTWNAVVDDIRARGLPR
jgi:hypothetical protein